MSKPVAFLTTTIALILFAGVSRAAAAATGEDVYMDKCSVCHGPDGAGKTARGKKLKVKDLRSPEAQKLTDAQLIDVVTKGQGKDMAGYEKELDKASIQQVVAFVRDLAKKK